MFDQTVWHFFYQNNLATLNLEKNNTTVAEADIVIELYNKLKSFKSQLADELAERIFLRYTDCRNKDLVSLARYLQNPDVLK